MTAIRVSGAAAIQSWQLVGLVVTLVLLPLIINLVSSELIDWCPRLAEKLVRWAARIQPPASRETREEEWLGILDETPGRMSKLLRAAWIAWCAPLTNRGAQGLPPLHEALRLRCLDAAATWRDRIRPWLNAAGGQPRHDQPGSQRLGIRVVGGQRLAVAPSPVVSVSVAVALLSITAASVLVVVNRPQEAPVSRPQSLSGDGPATAVQDAAGNIYIADTANNQILRIDASGTTTTVAGTHVPGFSGDGGPAWAARLSGPLGLAVDASGNLYIADRGNHRVRRVDPSGTITTVAGTGIAGFSGDGGPAWAAQLSGPLGLAVAAVGNLYIA
ncbi:MAG: SMP-30/gluconolactonase/LRE family protein, partial [Egibacteraceae bacterium]